MNISYNGKTLTLEAHQIEHYKRLMNIIERNICYLDFSDTGTGKMMMAIAIAMTCNFKVLVICPKIVQSKWIRELTNHNVKIVSVDSTKGENTAVGVISYDSLRTMKGYQPKHGLLKRYNHPEKGVIFAPTEKFYQLAKEGIFVIIDEAQKIKNNSVQYLACQALTTACLSMGGQSRIGLLSATPMEKTPQAINFLRLMGYIQHPELYKYNKNILKLTLLGAEELITVCRKMDSERTQDVLESFPLDHKNVPELCCELFINVIEAKIMSAMPPRDIGVEKDVKNGYYNMPCNEEKELSEQISYLNQVSHYDPNTHTYNRKKINWGAIKHAHMGCEYAKINLLSRLTKKTMTDDPKCKVIIAVSYTETINRLSVMLSEYSPMIMYGGTSDKDRDVAMENFCSDRTKRLLIVNISVANVGVDLDDRIGDQPRYMFIVPTYSIQDLHQVTGRIHRTGTKSKATIRFIYGNIANHKKETSILNALSKKADVLRRVLHLQAQFGYRFPGEYENWYESDPRPDVNTILSCPSEKIAEPNINQMAVVS